MLWWMVVRTAVASLLANKLRSALAALGIVIGVGAVIALLALGAGAQKQVLQQVSSLGTNLLIVRPGQFRGLRGVMSGSQENLTVEDAQAILDEVEGVRAVSPVASGGAQLKYYSKNTYSVVMGAAVTYFGMRGFAVERGRAFTEQEVNSLSRVAVLGPVTAENLFGASDPVDETVKLKGVNFRVVGVLKAKGDQGWFNPDEQAIIPFTTAMKNVFGQEKLREIDVQGRDGADLAAVQERTAALLRRRHRRPADAEDDFSIRNQAEMIEMISSVTRTFTLLLGGIAAISLLVGGIGIMNVMLVTVTERTREIGIRKAIGARRRDVLGQFIIEAVLLSGAGGLVGICVGLGLAFGVSGILDFLVAVRVQDVALALAFSAGVGVFFGWYPARRAAAMDPIVALRYE
jgi:ABC-type antimicrobial peptide transport system permease subunit